MEVYRLSREKFSSPLSGVGAAIKGARWNSVGIEMIYTAANRSLAMAEVAVHFPISTIPEDYVMITIFIPDDISMKKIEFSELPPNWNSFPHSQSTQVIGDKFILENRYCVLQIPSSVTQGDYNLLINPNHTEFKRIKIIDITRFTFDQRLFK
ncbi:MAG TPA: RES family NAD+ phosphorylase [Draconibacterium sp.]|nr:RES family NAD+ phosphorylase [Draconibacterium sp.]